MKRPAILIVGAVAGALLVAGIGASAHTGLFVNKSAGLSAITSDESSGARVEPSESPEPAETPEATPSPEPSEAAEAGDNDNQDEDNDDQGNGTGDHESGSSGSGGHDD
jgi:hypothetical protein